MANDLACIDIEPGTLPVLPQNVLAAVLRKLPITAFWSVACVSKDFYSLAKPTFESRYHIQYDGETHWDYTKLAYEFDALVHSARKENCRARVIVALKSSPCYRYIQSILEARFGYCIQYAEGGLPKFELEDFSLDILFDKRMIWVVPYVLDQRDCSSTRIVVRAGVTCQEQWILFIHELAELGRFDLLNQMRFPKIDSCGFHDLMSVALPESVVGAAARSLQRNEPASELANLLAFAGFGDQAAVLPEKCEVPLFIVPYLHRRAIRLPEGHLLVDTPERSSLSFWIYLLRLEASAAKKLHAFVLDHGDWHVQFMANAEFQEEPWEPSQYRGYDIWQAVVIRFRFSHLCTAHVVETYERMMATMESPRFYVASALYDCGQYEQIGCYIHDDPLNGQLAAHARRIRHLQSMWIFPFEHDCIGYVCRVPTLLKRWLKSKASEPCIQLLWGAIQMSGSCMAELDLCDLPLDAIRRLLFEPEVSIENVQEMFSSVSEFRNRGGRLPKEACLLHTVMFWEAPERVIAYYLDKVPKDYTLEDDWHVWSLVRLPKYSSKLWRELLRRFKVPNIKARRELGKYRPDMVEELDLPNCQLFGCFFNRITCTEGTFH